MLPGCFLQTAPLDTKPFTPICKSCPLCPLYLQRPADPFSLGSSCLLEMCKELCIPFQGPPESPDLLALDFEGHSQPSIFSLAVGFPCLFLCGGSLCSCEGSIRHVFKAAVLTHQSHLEDWFKHRFAFHASVSARSSMSPRTCTAAVS